MTVTYLMCLLGYLIATGAAHRTQRGLRSNVTDGSDVVARAAQLGLRATEHAVRTEDGHVLRVFRVAGPAASAGPPVLLMHGLLQSSIGWLDSGGAALGTLLAASGRDLWLGNARGSLYSLRHEKLQPTDPLFWQFSADEIGKYDLPALLDYILAATGSPTLDYIGFSQGAGTFFMMCSERPGYCNKVNLMIALGPATRMLHTRSLAFRFIVEYFEYNEQKLYEQGVWEAHPVGGLAQSFLKTFCELSEELCGAFLDIFEGANPKSITGPALQAATVTTPAGTSAHNMAWYGQHVKSNRFHKFDYGPDQNLVRYASRTAPSYNLSAVTVPTVVMYGRNDGIVDARDVRWLVRKLPNVKKVFLIEDPLWTHLDFVLSKNVPQLLFPKIEEVLRKHSRCFDCD